MDEQMRRLVTIKTGRYYTQITAHTLPLLTLRFKFTGLLSHITEIVNATNGEGLIKQIFSYKVLVVKNLIITIIGVETYMTEIT